MQVKFTDLFHVYRDSLDKQRYLNLITMNGKILAAQLTPHPDMW